MAKKKAKTGRKRIPDSEKTVLVGFYTKQTVIDHFGGLHMIREMAKRYVEYQADQKPVTIVTPIFD